MATRQERIAEFDTGAVPETGAPMELLCEDHVGTYTLPFLGIFKDAHWRNAKTMEPLDAADMGPSAAGLG